MRKLRDYNKMTKPNYRNKNTSKLRKTIAIEAAKLIYNQQEKEYFTAKRKAARKLRLDYKYNPSDLPSNKEIRDEVLKIAQLYEGENRYTKLKDMRLYAYWIMNELKSFSPNLIGSTLTGHIHKSSDIDIHVFSHSVSSVTHTLDNNALIYEVEKKRVVKYEKERIFTHIHIHGRYEVELTLYGKDWINYNFKSSITGKSIEKASLKEFKKILNVEYSEDNIEEKLTEYSNDIQCYEMFKMLLFPLENVQGGPYHPEGDTLYHSLQVFELAKKWHGYDLEFLQAALLHDVGKAIDPAYHAKAGAEVLEGFVSERVLFLIEHHMDALKLKQGLLGHKAYLKIKHSPYYEDLMTLRELDTKGREIGVIVDTIDEALDYLRSLENLDEFEDE